MQTRSILARAPLLAWAALMLFTYVLAIGVTSAAVADEPSLEPVAQGELTNIGRKRLRGSFEIVASDDGGHVLRFGEDFLASRGPDVKVFLSPQAYGDVTGDTAVDGSVFLGELASFRGAGEYRLPAGTDVAAFQSVLVHCEEYSVLWGGADL